MKKHIGLVLSKPPGYSETFFRSKIKGLTNAGYEVVLFVQETSTDFSLCNAITAPRKYSNIVCNFVSAMLVLFKLFLRYERFFRFLKLEKQNGRNLKRAIKNSINNSHIILYKKLDWLHFGFATMALGSETVAKAIGANMSVSLRGFDIAIYPLKHNNCYDLLWTQVDKLHSISNDLLRLAYEQGFPKGKPVAIIPPAIDVSFFTNELINPPEKKEKLCFLTVARLHWKKGLVDTLESLAILKSKGLDFEYNIVGIGEEESLLRFTIHQLNLEGCVNMMGKKSPSEVVDLMKETDIYLQYSISEGFCNAVLEAQAMGCLCIVSNAEGLKENVLDGETGWVVTKQNPKELVKIILRVNSLPLETKNSIRQNAQKRVFKEFNLSKQNKEFVQFYIF